MLSKVSAFFQPLSEKNKQQASELSLKIGDGVLLCEAMLANGQLDKAEQQKLKDIIANQFHLTSDEVTEIIKHSLLLC
ncbi:MAG: putative tellurite resistance protein B-like protein [Cognaticolwellia sp.]|jgi:uncharacterized tellurite resistance protein B-like protein